MVHETIAAASCHPEIFDLGRKVLGCDLARTRYYHINEYALKENVYYKTQKVVDDKGDRGGSQAN